MTDAIYTRIENGETPLVAAYKGSKQITFAIIATTLILVAVLLPLIFIKGISGTLFKETAIALSFSIVVSSFVALTLSPMLGSKFLNKKEKISIIWSSHDLDAVERLANKVACLNKTLFFHGISEDFFSDEEMMKKYSETSMQMHMHHH